MVETNGSDGGRLDRIEGIIEALANRQHLIEDEFARLLKAQVLMADHMERLTAKVETLAEVQKHTDDRMNALIGVVDDLARRRPQA